MLRSFSVERRPGRILTPRRGDHCFHAAPECALESTREKPLLVQCNWHGNETERMHEIGDPRPGRVLDGDPVTGPEPSLHDALDAVECAANDRDLTLDLVGSKVATS